MKRRRKGGGGLTASVALVLALLSFASGAIAGGGGEGGGGGGGGGGFEDQEEKYDCGLVYSLDDPSSPPAFYILGDTASAFFCPSLEATAAMLRMSPQLAGVTLLPLGNGAPDVFAAVAAFTKGGNGDVGLSSILGAGVFVTSVVVGLVCLVSDGVELDATSFKRDVSVYGLSALLATVIVVFANPMHWAVASVLLIAYCMYGALVLVMEVRKGGQQKEVNEMAMQLLDTSEAELMRDRDEGIGVDAPVVESFYSDDWDEVEDVIANRAKGQTAEANPLALLPQWRYVREAQDKVFHHLDDNVRPERPLWGWSEDEKRWWGMANLRKIRKVLGLVLYYAYIILLRLPRQLTIPSLSHNIYGAPDQWRRFHAALSAFLFPLFCVFATRFDFTQSIGALPVWSVCLICGAILSTLGLVTWPCDGSEPKNLVRMPWVLCSFAGSILWIYLVANELVATLVALGVIWKVNAAILGLTVLAWGNSVGDTMSNVNIARGDTEGGTGMAIAGCYAGPLFNLLVGLGGSLLIASINHPYSTTNIDVKQLLVAVIFLIANLFIAAVFIALRGYRTTRLLGAVLIFMYIAFSITSGLVMIL